jgi:hypothetical protein
MSVKIKSKVNPSAALRIDGERRPSTSLRPSPEFIEGRSRTIKSQKSKVKIKTKNIISCFSMLIFVFWILNLHCYAAPCYGTNMPKKNKISMGLEYHSILKRYLEDNYGKVRSAQQFLLLSYGIFDWFSIDLKGGSGNIKQRPAQGDEVRYETGFAGGYGLRLKFFDKKNIKMVFGFQHISVHPYSKHVGNVKNKAILDDWQTSLLLSYSFKKLTPYIGTRWSRIDYIHKEGDTRKRKMSDFTRDIGLICGFDIPLAEKIWINLEGSAFDSNAFAASINYQF